MSKIRKKVRCFMIFFILGINFSILLNTNNTTFNIDNILEGIVDKTPGDLESSSIDSSITFNNTDANFIIKGKEDGDFAGSKVMILGDVNGDGYDDYIIGAPGIDVSGHEDQGRCYLYYGNSSSNLETIDKTANLGDFANVTITGQFALDNFPSAITSGDINGDGLMDIILSSSDNDAQGYNTGAVYIIFGSTELDTTISVPIDSDVNIFGSYYNEHLGAQIKSGGDLNDDGCDDLIILAPLYNEGGGTGGAVYIFYGDSDLDPFYLSRTGCVQLTCYDYVTISLSDISDLGDINGDGYDDFMVVDDKCDGYRGRAFFILGKSAKITSGLLKDKATFSISNDEENYSYQFGYYSNIIGDINNDTYADYLIYSYTSGYCYGFYGSTDITNKSSSDSDFKVYVNDELIINPTGDINNDNIDDFAIYGRLTEKIYIFRGKAMDYEKNLDCNSADIIMQVYDSYDTIYTLVRTDFSLSGDINGDGTHDLLLGVGYSTLEVIETKGVSYLFLDFESNLGNMKLGTFDLANPHVANNIIGETVDGYFGRSVEIVGDVNGDGYADIAIGTPRAENTLNYEGRVDLFYGSETLSLIDLNVSDSDVVFNGGLTNIYAGSSIAAAGDVNKDGFMDILIGAPGYDDLGTDEGCVYLIYGSDSMPTTYDLDADCDAKFYGTYDAGRVGGAYIGNNVDSIAGNGDLNGDGYADIVISAYYGDPSVYTDAGEMYVIYGSASIPAINDLSTDYDIRIRGGADYDYLGRSISISGDINGDGYDDLLFSYPGCGSFDGAAIILYGSDSLSSSYDTQGMADTTPIFLGIDSNDDLGYSLDIIGDINGDHYDDIVITTSELGASHAYLIYGYEGLETTGQGGDDITDAADADFYFSSAEGNTVSKAGDLNNDGLSDFMVTTFVGTTAKIFIVYGNPINYSGNIALETYANVTYIYDNDDIDEEFCLSGGYDLNGDNRDDVIIGFYGYNRPDVNGDSDGQAFLIFGESSITAPLGVTTLNNSDGLFYNGDETYLGNELENIGDINGDGVDDLALYSSEADSGSGEIFIKYGAGIPDEYLGVWNIQNEYDVKIYDSMDKYMKAGASIAAGDYNGDGFNDLIIGAPMADVPIASVNSGEVFLLLGSDSLESEININQCKKIMGASGGAWLGNTVACAGDVNDDGYDDFMINSPMIDNGTVYFFYGSSHFLPNSYIADADIIFEGPSSASWFGKEMDSGDFNNDGFSDIAFSAYSDDSIDTDQGAVYLIYGNISLLDTYNVSTMANLTIYGENSGDMLGIQLAMGDLNNDGCSDLLFTSTATDSNNGKIYGLFGSEDAISGELGFSEMDLIINGTNGQKIGYSLDISGDLNNDGYGDLIVSSVNGNNHIEYGGSPRRQAYLFYGSDNLCGNITSDFSNATFISNTVGGYYLNVKIVGDINDDGYDDLVISMPRCSDFIFDGGVMYLIFGGSTQVARIENLQINPDPILADSLVTAEFDIVGGELATCHIEWWRESTHYPEFDDLLSFQMDLTHFWWESGWCVKIYYTDAFGRSGYAEDWASSSHSDPEAKTVRITPYQPLNGSDLTLSYDYYDADGHSEITMGRSITWYKNGQYVSTAKDELTLSNTYTNDGDLWYAVISVYDGISYSKNYTSNAVYVLPRTDPIIESPANITMEIEDARSEDITLEWSIYDPVSNQSGRCYSLFYNGFVISGYQNLTWSNSENVTYIRETKAITAGTGVIKIEVMDGYDGFAQAEMNITIYDNAPTITDSPDDVTFTANTTGNYLSWTANDNYGSDKGMYYGLILNTTTDLGEGEWANDIPINYEVDIENLAPGDYNISIEIGDGISASVVDWVIVTIENPNPICSQPSDIRYINGSTNHNFSWTIFDSNVYTPLMRYNISRDGTIFVENAVWSSGSSILVDVSGLDVGTHLYTINAHDGQGGTIQDTVKVIIEASTNTTTTNDEGDGNDGDEGNDGDVGNDGDDGNTDLGAEDPTNNSLDIVLLFVGLVAGVLVGILVPKFINKKNISKGDNVDNPSKSDDLIKKEEKINESKMENNVKSASENTESEKKVVKSATNSGNNPTNSKKTTKSSKKTTTKKH